MPSASPPAPTKVQHFHAAPIDSGTRLDVFLTARAEDVSRSRVQHLVDQGRVTVNGKVEKASYRLRGDETVTLTGSFQAPPLNAIAENIPLDVVYEDSA